LRRLSILSALIGVSALAFYMTRIEPASVRVRYVPLTLPRLGKAFHRYTLAHISDIHMGEWMTAERLMPTIQLINDLHPDAVVITGDFVSRYTEAVGRSLVEPLRALRAPDGKFAVLGNHDYAFHPQRVRALLAECDIVDLSNTVHTLRRGNALLYLAGVDDIVEYEDCLDMVLEGLSEAGAAILLAHEPDFADISAATGRFDLQLSGHTHGGQVRIPFVGAPMLPSHGQRYPSGLYHVNGMYLYTNRGLGMIAPFVRLNAPPEITVFILETPQ
jgi:hypothetical protein